MKFAYVRRIDDKGRIELHSIVQELLGFVDSATVYFQLVKSVFYHQDPHTTTAAPQKQEALRVIVSSIDPNAWKRLYDIEFRLGDEPGSFSCLADFLGKNKLNISLGDSRTVLCNVRAEANLSIRLSLESELEEVCSTQITDSPIIRGAEDIERELAKLVQEDSSGEIRRKIKAVRTEGDREIYSDGRESPLRTNKIAQAFAPGTGGEPGYDLPVELPPDNTYSVVDGDCLKLPTGIVKKIDEHFADVLREHNAQSIAGQGHAIVVANFEAKALTLTFPPPGSRIVRLDIVHKDEAGALSTVAKFLAIQSINVLESRLHTLCFSETAEWKAICDITKSNYAGYSARQLESELVRDMKAKKVKLYACAHPIRVVESVGNVGERERALDEAYDLLVMFESKLKNFIECELQREYGDKWWNIGIPGDIREKAENRKQKESREPYALRSVAPRKKLISYIAFVDYQKILGRKDNWEKIFRLTFRRKEALISRLEAIAPIRNKIAHVEPLEPHELNSLRVRTRELINAIERGEELQAADSASESTE